jgi:D-glycero-alpha-D-manno-heptose-7-phosphate kinase
MIISKTPFRFSFAGGGTDFPEWFINHPSVVISGTINKFSYLTCRKLENYFDHNFRIVYSKIENTKSVDEIVHPAVREILKLMNYPNGFELHHDGDLPARTGLGSSSAFTVGLLHIICELMSKKLSRKELAELAIKVEREILNENVGMQDQIACSYGGLNKVEFSRVNGENIFKVEKIDLDRNRLENLENQIILVYTGIQRFSSEVSQNLVDKISNGSTEVKKLQMRNVELALETEKILKTNEDLDLISEIFQESWSNKEQLNPQSITSELKYIRDLGLKNGSSGAKVLGAGGGGFIAFWVPLAKAELFNSVLNNFVKFNIKFEFEGSKIIYNSETVNGMSLY